MRSKGNSAPYQKGYDLYAAIIISESSCRESSARRNSDKGVNHIPEAVEERNFVSDKLHNVESAGHTNDPPTGERFEFARQTETSESTKQAKRCNRSIEIYAAHPRSAHRQSKRAYKIHLYLRASYFLTNIDLSDWISDTARAPLIIPI
jgi:hypothetical protein